MSYRRILEPSRSQAQYTQEQAGRIRRLEGHAWGGALRSASLAAHTSALGTVETVLSLTLNAGRWAVFQRGTPTITDVTETSAVTMTGTMRATTVSPSTNPLRPIAAPRSVPPIRAEWIHGALAISARLTLNAFGVLAVDEQSTLDLTLLVDNLGGATWTDLQLLAIPA